MIAAVAMVVRGHKRVDRDALPRSSPARPEHDQAHAELRHRIGGVRGEPFLLHVERRRQHQNVRVGRLGEIGDGVFRHHEGAARVDPKHQIEALHVGLRGIGELDGAGVVDHDVEAAEMRHGLIEGRLHCGFLAHVDGERERVAAGLFDLGRGGVDGAFELGMRLDGLGGNGDIGAVGGGFERDREPDAARAAGDEQGLALQRHWWLPAVLRIR